MSEVARHPAYEGLCIDGPNKGKFMCNRYSEMSTVKLPALMVAPDPNFVPSKIETSETVYHWIPSPFPTAPELGVWSVSRSPHFNSGHFQTLLELAAR